MIFDYKNIKALNKTEASIYNYIIFFCNISLKF